MTEFNIRVEVAGDGIGALHWGALPEDADRDTLARAVSMAADDALIGQGLRRLEVGLLDDDRVGRRALHLAGFRREGVRRAAAPDGEGGYRDVVLYARLISDRAYGRETFSAVMNTVLPTKRAIGHVVFRDGQGRLLLCHTHFKADWELPGGVIEQHESPRTGATREVVEELALEVPDLVLLAVDWMPRFLGWDDALEFIFDGGVLDDDQIAAIVKQDSEIEAVHWVGLDDLDDRVSELSARRLRYALSLPPGVIAYLENGYPLT